VQGTILNSTRRSSASTALSVPLPTMFCLKPMPLVFVFAASVDASPTRRWRMKLARCSESASFAGSEPVWLVWPTMFMQTFALVLSRAIWRSHIG
jgi:hypothetical protein